MKKDKNSTKQNVIILTDEDKELFVNAILNPAEPNDALKKAHLNYKKFNDDNNIVEDNTDTQILDKFVNVQLNKNQ